MRQEEVSLLYKKLKWTGHVSCPCWTQSACPSTAFPLRYA